MSLSKSIGAPSDFPTLKQAPHTDSNKLPRNQKKASFLRLVSARLSLHSSSIVNNFPSLNLGKVSSTTHFLAAVSHVLCFEFNAKLDAYVYTV